MERTIRVTGKGTLAVKPDRIRILIHQTELLENYEGAVSASAEKKTVLTDALAELGFPKEELKTLSFNIQTEYESYQAKDKSWKERILGYRFTHRMKLEFPNDNALLGKVLGKLAVCPDEPNFSIEYTVSDPEAAKNELLAKAVRDSREKAGALTEAAEVTLGEIRMIDYSWGEIEFVSRPMRDFSAKACLGRNIESDEVGLDIEADDIRVEDTVTVVWEIR